MQPPLSRRALLRASGPALAAALAGCSLTDGQETDTPPRTTPKPDGPDTITTTEVQSDALPTTASNQPTTDRCRSGTVEPTVSEGGAHIYHQRHETGTTLLRESVTIFNDTYDVSVTTRRVPDSSYWAKLDLEIPTEAGAELFEWRHDAAPQVPVGEFVVDQADKLRVDPCQYTDPAWDAVQYQGHTIGLPVSAETVALYYNEAIVEDPPETLAEMQAVMADHHDPANDQYGLNIHLGPYHLSGFAQAYGGEIYDGETDELGLTSDAVERGFRVFFEELAPYTADPDNEYAEYYRAFENDNTAFAIDGPWRVESLSETDVEWGVTTLPALPDGGEMRPYMSVQMLYFSTRIDADPIEGQVARQFAEWYTTNESVLRRKANRARYVPVYAPLVGDSELPDLTRVFSEQCARGYPMPANMKMHQVWGPVGDLVEGLYEGETDLAEGLAAAEERIREEWVTS